MSIKLIVSDIDGCIVRGKMKSIDIASIQELAEHNLKAQKGECAPITICSGRAQPYVEAIMQLIEGQGTAICENGAFLYDFKEHTVMQNPKIQSESLKALKELRHKLNNGLLDKWKAGIMHGKEICLSLVLQNSTEYEKLSQLVSEVAPDELFNITYSFSAVDITPHGVNKGSGLEALSQYTQTQLSQILGIGDSVGDIPFLERVGFSACPQNSDQRVKHIVDYVSPYEHTVGVCDIIRHFT